MQQVRALHHASYVMYADHSRLRAWHYSSCIEPAAPLHSLQRSTPAGSLCLRLCAEVSLPRLSIYLNPSIRPTGSCVVDLLALAVDISLDQRPTTLQLQANTHSP